MAEVAKSLPNLDSEVLGKQKSLASEEARLFPSGDPNRICMVMRAHNAERAREFIMRPNATP